MPAITEPPDLVRLLQLWQQGDNAALKQLSERVYQQLHQQAANFMWHERADHTLQATALVNEAFIQLMATETHFKSPLHFYRSASRIMRHILVDYARTKLSLKRAVLHAVYESPADTPAASEIQVLIDLHNALRQLAEFDPAKSDILDLHYFSGLTTAEIAQLYGVSARTIERNTKLAKAWIQQAI